MITINVGGCGVNLGQTVTERYCAEQGIACDGTKEYKTPYDDTIATSFEERSDGKYVPRSLMIDLDPYSINNIKNLNKYHDLFSPQYLIHGTEDAANNFARGRYSVGKQIIDEVTDKVRHAVECCGNLQGFIMHHSVAGGTGGGLGSLILERLSIDYRKKTKMGFDVFPETFIAGQPASLYNVLLSTHCLLYHADISMVLENLAISLLCREELDIKAPQYQNYNYLLNKLISSITAPQRYRLNENLNSLVTNLVPFPRLHFMTTAMWPMIPFAKYNDNSISNDHIKALTSKSVSSEHFFLRMCDFDPEDDPYMAVSFNYRGNKIKEHTMEVNDAMNWLNTEKKIRFVDDVVNIGMKFVEQSIPKLPLDDVTNTDRNVTMIGNNVSVSRLFSERIVNPFNVLYSQRAYVHWFVGEGMEEGELREARESMCSMQKDYLNVL
eukprot:414200_1